MMTKSAAYSDNMGMVSRVLKRAFDIVLSVSLVVVTLPVTMVIYVMLRIELNESAFFLQERIGRGGKAFWIWKFRTMRNEGSDVDTPTLATDDDARLTPVGRVLRAHHLDELPQLWNVLRGDMSFVGYRPERRYFIDKIMCENPAYEYLFQIQPGVTSPATLYNGYTDTMDKMLRRLDMDLEYMTKRTILLDLRIMFLTGWYTIIGRKF